METDLGDVAALSFVDAAVACRIAEILKEDDIPVAWNPRLPRGSSKGTYVYYLRRDGDQIRVNLRTMVPDAVIVHGKGVPGWARYRPIEHRWMPGFWSWLGENELA